MLPESYHVITVYISIAVFHIVDCTDTAPRQSVARFALVMAASLAVYLQLMASLSKLSSISLTTSLLCPFQVIGKSFVRTRWLLCAVIIMHREAWTTLQKE